MQIVPKDIASILTAKGLAYRAGNDGFTSASVLGFATNAFLYEVELLSYVLLTKSCLVNTINNTASG
jgi:hypothetical protein